MSPFRHLDLFQRNHGGGSPRYPRGIVFVAAIEEKKMRVAGFEEMIVGEVIDRWPATVAVFNARRMACPGCVMARFMTVAESAAAYGLETTDLVRDLMARIDGGEAA